MPLETRIYILQIAVILLNVTVIALALMVLWLSRAVRELRKLTIETVEYDKDTIQTLERICSAIRAVLVRIAPGQADADDRHSRN